MINRGGGDYVVSFRLLTVCLHVIFFNNSIGSEFGSWKVFFVNYLCLNFAVNEGFYPPISNKLNVYNVFLRIFKIRRYLFTWLSNSVHLHGYFNRTAIARWDKFDQLTDLARIDNKITFFD